MKRYVIYKIKIRKSPKNRMRMMVYHYPPVVLFDTIIPNLRSDFSFRKFYKFIKIFLEWHINYASTIPKISVHIEIPTWTITYRSQIEK